MVFKKTCSSVWRPKGRTSVFGGGMFLFNGNQSVIDELLNIEYE
jgi:hypothetical protein